MNELSPEQARKMREMLDQSVWDGNDAGELVNLRNRLYRYEEILAKVSDVLGCPQDFGMILPNLLELKKQTADAREWSAYEKGRERAENRAQRFDPNADDTEMRERREARDRFNAGL